MKKLFILSCLVFCRAYLSAQDFAIITKSSFESDGDGKGSKTEKLTNAAPSAVAKTIVNSVDVSKDVMVFSNYRDIMNTDNIPAEDIENHFLGKEIAKKMYLFEKAYTYQEAIAPGNPQMKTLFRKPTIYNSVKKIEHHLKKSFKKDEISIEQASTMFNQVLDVALTVSNIYTEDFEKRINAENDKLSLLVLYTQYVRLNFLD